MDRLGTHAHTWPVAACDDVGFTHTSMDPICRRHQPQAVSLCYLVAVLYSRW